MSEVRRFPLGQPNSDSLKESLCFSCSKEGLADVDDRFSAASDSARDLQHHRLPDARRFLCRPGSEADLDVRGRVAADAERYASDAGDLDVAVRGDQGGVFWRYGSH